MKILIADYGAYPFVLELCRHLVNEGHDITLAYASFFGGPASLSAQSITPYRQIRIELEPFAKDHFLKRVKHEAQFGRQLKQHIELENYDKIIFANIPLISLRPVTAYLTKIKKEYIIWLQDLLSVAAASILSDKFGAIGKIPATLFGWMERHILAGAKRIICIDEAFKTVLQQWDIDLQKVHVMFNWAPLDDFPVLDKDNPFSSKHHLKDKFLILYAGTLGMKQNPLLLYRLAERLSDYPDILLMVISEGIGAEFLRNELEKKSLPNLKIHPYLALDDLPQALAAADILLTLLNDDAAAFCVPSKTWSHLAAGRPQILVMPEHNQAAREVLKAKAGMVVSHDQESLLVKYILELYQHPEKRSAMGNNARQYARNSFKIKNKVQDFMQIIEY